MPTLAIVIVSWNTRDLLRQAILSAQASLGTSAIDSQCVIVDNGSSDGTVEMLHAEFPNIQLIEAGRNLGFAGGNNLGMAWLGIGRGASRADALDYVLLLNPDTESRDDAIPQLVAYLEAHPDVAVVGPQLRYPDGSLQSSRRRDPSRGVFFLESTPLENVMPQNATVRHYHMDDRSADHEQAVDWLVGAALLVRRSAIERAGLLDDGFRMYSEELEWQQRIRRSGAGAVVYLPSALIVHYEGQSSSQAPARRYVQFHQSRMRYVRMTYGPIHALGLWVFLELVYGGELLIEALKWILGHKRALRAQRISVYAQFLRKL